jgi:RNA polymerase sigma-70 factor (ECF subfamily)
MSDDVEASAEEAIRIACEAQDFQSAASLALDAYGREIMSFLIARMRAVTDAEEIFSMFAEDLWKGLPAFGFRCSARGWLYALARNAANRYATSPQLRAARNVPLSRDGGVVSGLIEQARSATQLHQRTDVKDKIRSLRRRLAPDDQTLLMLFVDRNLPWREIAMVMHEQGEQLDAGALDREAARLRKRFERVKAELKALAIAEGLLKH